MLGAGCGLRVRGAGCAVRGAGFERKILGLDILSYLQKCSANIRYGENRNL